MDDDHLLQLTIYRGNELVERRREWKQMLKIGSGRWSDVRLDGPGVARAHALLINSSGGSVILQDRRSDLTCPETRADGHSAFGRPLPLRSGAVVDIGAFRLVVAFGPDVQAAEPEPPLAPPPRRVPSSMLFAELFASSSWFAFGAYVWVLFMVAIVPIGVWHSHPEVFPPVGLVTMLILVGLRIARVRRRLALLRWGAVAEVVAVQTDTTNTSWRGVPLPVARGWHVDRGTYSGFGYRNTVKYRAVLPASAAPFQPEGGYRAAMPRPEAPPVYEGWIVIKGRKYQGGVVLYDVRKPSSALCVDAFASDLDRDPSGNFLGRLRVGNWIAAALLSIVTLGWLVGIAVMAVDAYGDPPGRTPATANPAVTTPAVVPALPAVTATPARPAQKPAKAR